MFNIPRVTPLRCVDRYEVNGRLMCVFAKSSCTNEVYCAALPDCEFTGNQLRKFYKYANLMYGLSKVDFYGQYRECDGCYGRIIRKPSVDKFLYLVGSEAYVKAIAEEWEKHL